MRINDYVNELDLIKEKEKKPRLCADLAMGFQPPPPNNTPGYTMQT